MTLFFLAYLILAGLALGQAVVLGIQAWEHRRYARSCLRDLNSQRPSGRAAVFVPCKGYDVDLAENLRAVLRQDYEDYEVAFIVESSDDPAVATLRQVMAEYPQVATRLLVVGKATDSGQKVHNLRMATELIRPEIKYLAFVDSDAGPRREWLRVMLSRIAPREGSAKPDVCVATGYRWFLPQRPTVANHLLYSINCGVMALLGRSSHYLVWGGCWGIRRETFETIGLRDAWQGTLSDDMVATRVLRQNRLRVRFEPACVVGSPLDQTLRQTFSFLRRQYMVARFYAPLWWAFALLNATLINLAYLGGLAVFAVGMLAGSPMAWAGVGTTVLLYGLGVFRAAVRQGLTSTYFPEQHPSFSIARRWDMYAGPLAGLANGLALLGSMVGRHITWRGICYRMLPGGKIRIAWRRETPPTKATDEPEYRDTPIRRAA